MTNPPLKLDWSELLPGRDDAPPPEVEVVSGGGGGEAAQSEGFQVAELSSHKLQEKIKRIPKTLNSDLANKLTPEVEVVSSSGGGGDEAAQSEGFQVAELSNHALQEKIKRISNTLNSDLASKLPDRGEKLRSTLRQSQDEVDRRSFARIPKNVGECERATTSKSMISSDSLEDFGFHFSGKLEDKIDAAFSEELRFISHDKYKSSRENGLKMQEGRHSLQKSSQPAKISSGELPSACFPNKGKQRFSKGDHRNIESSGISSSRARRHLFRHFSKRRKASVKRDSMDWEFKKVQDVVLLDDEDVQPIEPVHGDDTPDEWKESKIYYPSRDDPECVELSYLDITCLDPESYLSSPIMNFYIQYLQRSLSPIGRPRGECFIFNTYFYRKLEEAVSCKGDRTASFLKLRRWWKGVDIFQKSYIFLPIHRDLHWSLVIISIPAKEDESGPIVLHLDSLGLHASNQIFATVHSYLKEEWNYINQNAPLPDLPISERIWKNLPRRIEKKKIMVPQQKNDYDCGLFVLYFMERFIGEAPERLRKKDLDMFGSKWFKPEEASGLRERIRELLIEEFKSNRLENGTTESPTSSGTCENDKEQGSKP